jgi:hypothetical protein
VNFLFAGYGTGITAHLDKSMHGIFTAVSLHPTLRAVPIDTASGGSKASALLSRSEMGISLAGLRWEDLKPWFPGTPSGIGRWSW